MQYSFSLEGVWYGDAVIEADSEEEAREKAQEKGMDYVDYSEMEYDCRKIILTDD